MSPKLLVLFFCVIAAASALNAPDSAKFKRDCKDGVVTPDYKLDFARSIKLLHIQWASKNLRYKMLFAMLGAQKVKALSDKDASGVCVTLFKASERMFVGGVPGTKPDVEKADCKGYMNDIRLGTCDLTYKEEYYATSYTVDTDNESYILKEHIFRDGTKGFALASVGDKTISDAKLKQLKKKVKDMGYTEDMYDIVDSKCIAEYKKAQPLI